MHKPKLTVHDLLAGKGKIQRTEVYTEVPEEAAACEAAGIDMLVTPEGFTEVIREAAPNTFLTVGCGVESDEMVSAADCVRVGKREMLKGADAIYTGVNVEWVAAMAAERIPVVGHVGYVPYRSSWYGGARAVGKTGAEALDVHRATVAYQEAGAIAVEMEIVPEAVATEISRRVDLMVISMGSGAGCDAQYLFAEDLLGTNTGHIPRHAKVYADINSELARVQQVRIDALAQFHNEVADGTYPAREHDLTIASDELKTFLAGLD